MSILIAMNIYITKDNEEFLRTIPGDKTMSGLINKLLNDYRAGRGPDLFPPDVKKETFSKLKESIDPRAGKALCKIHGTPLDDRGRCLQKGCKYA